jgi:transcriptional regulator with XRE-family HTH domain
MSQETNHRVRLFGQAVRKRRHELDMSQETLAEAAGLHRTYVADIERGTRNLSLLNIFKLADALDMSVGELFTKYVETEIKGGEV